jgi:hypothetical protein
MESVARELFGGAIRISVPPRFEDVSGVRQIPDNQEVFVCQESDQSIIIEILELAEEVCSSSSSSSSSCLFFFDLDSPICAPTFSVGVGVIQYTILRWSLTLIPAIVL